MSKETGGTRRFHLSNIARKYFEKIGVERNKGDSKSGMFNSYLQPYYLCMLMGMVKNSSRAPDKMTKDMVSVWMSSAKETELEISGLAFYYYCKKKGISEADDRVLKLMEGFFAQGRAEVYDKEAFNMMNKYAQGGFDYISENLGLVTDLADLLTWYMQELENGVVE
jgi:hypothetical protein